MSAVGDDLIGATGQTIGALAAMAGVNVETVRYYQRRGLLAEPKRHVGQVRRYRQPDLDRLRFIRSAQNLGFSLDEAAELLRLDDGTGCVQARQLGQRKLQEVQLRQHELARMAEALSQLLSRCSTARGRVRCPLIDALHDKAPR